MVSAASTTPLAGTTHVPDTTNAYAFVAFRQRCEQQPEPWRSVPGPVPLDQRKARQEARQVATAKRKPTTELLSTYRYLVHDIEVSVARFKQAYTEFDAERMVSIAKALRQPVHKLRVVAMAEQQGPVALPPRRSQMGSAQVNATDRALAWIHQIDLFLVGNEKKSGVPVDVWRRHFHVGTLDPFVRFAELKQTARLRREPQYRRLDRVESLVERLRSGLNAQADTLTYPRLDQTVRALRVNLTSLGHQPVPPHWLQYRFAGGFPADNCRVWRSGLVGWLDEYDRVPTYQVLDENGSPPAYELPLPPAYTAEKKRKSAGWRRFLLIA